MVTKIEVKDLPGIPELADMLLGESMKREDDPELYDSCKTHLQKYMSDMNSDGDGQEKLGFYGEFVAAFSTGFCAAREICDAA